jgi:hypothetical protein
MTEEIIPPVLNYWKGMAIVTVIIVTVGALLYVVV